MIASNASGDEERKENEVDEYDEENIFKLSSNKEEKNPNRENQANNEFANPIQLQIFQMELEKKTIVGRDKIGLEVSMMTYQVGPVV